MPAKSLGHQDALSMLGASGSGDLAAGGAAGVSARNRIATRAFTLCSDVGAAVGGSWKGNTSEDRT
jgi:hypothetical protein